MSKSLGSSVLSGSSISTVAGNGMTALGAVGLVLALLSVILLTVVVLKFKDKFSNKVNIAFPASRILTWFTRNNTSKQLLLAKT